MPDLEFPGHCECEALVRDVVPLVGKVESPDVHHQLTLHVLHVVMQRRDEMPDTRETCRIYKRVLLLSTIQCFGFGSGSGFDQVRSS
jgi:hypothetical protein